MLKNFDLYLNKLINLNRVKTCLQPLIINKRYSYFKDSFMMIRSVLRYTTVNGYIKQNSLGKISYSYIYNINKAKAASKTTYELGWIDYIDDLRILIDFIENIPNETCKFALYTGLKSMNIRNLTLNNLKIDKNKKVLFTF